MIIYYFKVLQSLGINSLKTVFFIQAGDMLIMLPKFLVVTFFFFFLDAKCTILLIPDMVSILL